MKVSKQQLDKIEEALVAAHRRQEDLPLPPDWGQLVMNDIKARPASAPGKESAETLAPRRTLYFAAVALASVIAWLTLANLDWHDPWISLKPTISTLEARAEFWLEAGDTDSGLRRLRVTLIQAEKQIELLSHSPKPPEGFWGAGEAAVKQVAVPLLVDGNILNLQEGPAKLLVMVHDLSWRNFFQGRLAILEYEIEIRLKSFPEFF